MANASQASIDFHLSIAVCISDFNEVRVIAAKMESLLAMAAG
jgi:hypothetical protein